MSREAVIQLLRNQLGVDLALDGERLRIDQSYVELPEASSDEWDLLDLPHALPSRAHGDAREKLLYTIVQDAFIHSSRSRLPTDLDAELRSRLEQVVPIPEPDRQIVAAAMGDAYWVTPQKRPYLIPYHSLLPTSYLHSTVGQSKGRTGRILPARYKLFRGVILLFLSWTGSTVNEALVQDLLDVMNGTDGFTALDELFLDAVRADGAQGGNASVTALLETYGAAVAESLGDGAFCQPTLDRFQADLAKVLSMKRLPRRDLLDVITGLLSLHLAIYYYRIALILGEEVDLAIGATGGVEVPDGTRGCDCSGGLSNCPLAGRIRFRVGTSGDRPVSLRDGCAVAHRDIDRTRLLGLPATIIVANVGQRIWTALGGPPGRPQLLKLSQEAAADQELAVRFNAAATAWAALYALEKELASTPEEASNRALQAPGLSVLRDHVLEHRRTRLKHLSRDVVNQLAKRESGGSLIRTRGRVTFFELDEDFLFLLVKLICDDQPLPFDEFVTGLRDYGLAPQDADEGERLADALEHLGMLHRYSDAGESIYVHHNL